MGALGAMLRVAGAILLLGTLPMGGAWGQSGAAEAWQALVERDASVEFGRSSGLRAAEAYRGGGLSLVDRAAALFVIGHAGSSDELDLLASVARDGAGPERLAAVLALGEFDLPQVGLLEGLLSDPDPRTREAAILALLRSGDEDAVAKLGPLVSAGGAVGARVAALARFASDRTQAEPSELGSFWLELRYRGARLFGLIDGRSWRVQELERLSNDAAFLDAVVLPLASEIGSPAVKDHLVALLLESPGPLVYEGCLRAIPSEFSLIVRNGIWLPETDRQWRELLAAIERSPVRLEVVDVLDRALGVATVRYDAALRLLEAGDRRGWEVVSKVLVQDDAQARGEVASALGRSGDTEWMLELQRLRDDPSAEVRARAIVARVRLGELSAYESALATMAEPESKEELIALAQALVPEVDDVRVQALMEQALLRVDGRVAAELVAALAMQGRAAARATARALFEDGSQPGMTATLVRALGSFADEGDLVRLRSMFPVGSDPVLDLELGRALVRNRESRGLQLVRAAIWERGWHESVLAALLLADLEGLHTLHGELQSPPPRASRSDLRRLGYAIGLLGGIDEVDRLALRRNSGDPALQGAYLGALASRTY